MTDRAHGTNSAGSGGGISRRTLVKGAAWSVPVIAVGSRAPAMAVTGSVTTEFVGACKAPGGSCTDSKCGEFTANQDYSKGYALGFKVTANTSVPVVVQFDCVRNVILNGAGQDWVIYSGKYWKLEAGDTATVYVGVTNPTGNSADGAGSATIFFSWYDPNESPLDCRYEFKDVAFDSTPPCDRGVQGKCTNCPPVSSNAEEPPPNEQDLCLPNPLCGTSPPDPTIAEVRFAFPNPGAGIRILGTNLATTAFVTLTDELGNEVGIPAGLFPFPPSDTEVIVSAPACSAFGGRTDAPTIVGVEVVTAGGTVSATVNLPYDPASC